MNTPRSRPGWCRWWPRAAVLADAWWPACAPTRGTLDSAWTSACAANRTGCACPRCPGWPSAGRRTPGPASPNNGPSTWNFGAGPTGPRQRADGPVQQHPLRLSTTTRRMMPPTCCCRIRCLENRYPVDHTEITKNNNYMTLYSFFYYDETTVARWTSTQPYGKVIGIEN